MSGGRVRYAWAPASEEFIQAGAVGNALLPSILDEGFDDPVVAVNPRATEASS